MGALRSPYTSMSLAAIERVLARNLGSSECLPSREVEEGEDASPPCGFAYATVVLAEDSVFAVYSVRLKSNSGGIEETTPKREESAQ